MITFKELSNTEIYNHYNNHYHEDARYFEVINKDKRLCIYGVISRTEDIVEAFWILGSLNKKVVSKTFFHSLFNHCFSLGYKEIYTWVRCKKMINILGHFKNFGIEKIDFPEWDNDSTKTWFMKRI